MSDRDVPLADVARRLAAAERILLTCHRRPDGDSLGSMVALAALLRARGKHATLYNPDLAPRRFKWLPLTKTLIRALRPESTYEVTVVVDTADPALLGPDFPPRAVTGELIVLDHHSSGVPFGDLRVCDPSVACVGVLVARIADANGWLLDADAATALYLTLVTDTGGFRHANTNAEALALAARLVERGADPHRIAVSLEERNSLGRFRLLTAALATVELHCDGALAIMTVTADMVTAARASWDDTEGFVNYPRSLDGVACGAFLTTARGGGVRVSMRARGERLDAGAVCQSLGGGGHLGAAGCLLPGDIASARAAVIAAVTAALRAAPAAP